MCTDVPVLVSNVEGHALYGASMIFGSSSLLSPRCLTYRNTAVISRSLRARPHRPRCESSRGDPMPPPMEKVSNQQCYKLLAILSGLTTVAALRL